MDIPQELVQDLARGNAVLFAGAGLSTAAGLPGWVDLVRPLAEAVDNPLPPDPYITSDHLLDATQYYENAKGRHALISYLQEQLDTTLQQPSPNHALLARLPVQTIFTTNYDDLIERSLQAAQRRYNPITRESQLPQWSKDRLQLVKLNGDLRQPDTIVITRNDYNTYFERHRLLVERLRSDLVTATFLFLGYSLTDPDFNLIFDEIIYQLTAAAAAPRMSFAVMFGAPPLRLADLRRRGLHVINLDPGADRTAQLGEWLSSLLAASGGPAPGTAPAPQVAQPPSPPAARPEVAPRAAHATPASKPPPATAAQPRPWLPFKLQLDGPSGLAFDVRGLETPMGEPQATGQLPFAAPELAAVLQLLESGSYFAEDYSPAQAEALASHQLIRDGRLAPDYLVPIGRALYAALFPADLGVAMQVALNQARRQRETVALQLRFDPDAVQLASYPWELLHDGHGHLVASGRVELTRTITFPQAAPELPAQPPWRLLYVMARPKDLAALPAEEQAAVWSGLQPLAQGDSALVLEQPVSPTYDALLQQLDTADYHILHFDGHGLVARRCPNCRALAPARAPACPSCQASLDGVEALGYLAFEDREGRADFVSTVEMENLLAARGVRLVFLSACESSALAGDSLFGALGPGLVRAGVPAVLAMQLVVPAASTVDFAGSFYAALARGETIARAVAGSRRRLFRAGTWFIPALYLRSQDDEGRLFGR